MLQVEDILDVISFQTLSFTWSCRLLLFGNIIHELCRLEVFFIFLWITEKTHTFHHFLHDWSSTCLQTTAMCRIISIVFPRMFRRWIKSWSRPAAASRSDFHLSMFVEAVPRLTILAEATMFSCWFCRGPALKITDVQTCRSPSALLGWDGTGSPHTVVCLDSFPPASCIPAAWNDSESCVWWAESTEALTWKLSVWCSGNEIKTVVKGDELRLLK